MRISTPQSQTHGINSILDKQDNLVRLQQQISLGKKLLEPADDPVASTSILALNQELQANTQYQKNVDTAKSTLEIEENALDAANKIYSRIRELAVYAGDGALTNESRGYIVAEIQQRLGQMVDLANTRGANGEYLFSGFKGQGITVSQNSAGQYIYGGDEGQRLTKIGSTTTVATNDTGKTLFFQLNSADILSTIFSGLATTTIVNSGLINVTPSPAFQGIAANQLMLNEQAIPVSISDGVSSTLAQSSAIAIVNAINTESAIHGVIAYANANAVNLGIVTAGAIPAGQFSINGVSIVSVLGTEADIITQINNASLATGITATQPGGAGTNVVLSAADGRNIQLTTGAAFSTFAIGPNIDQVQRSAVTLFKDQPFTIGGSNPGAAGLAAGTVAVTANTGNATATSMVIGLVPEPITKPYSIRFSSSSTFSIYDDTNPNTPLSGFTNLNYTDGNNIDFNGIRVIISGTPTVNDRFTVNLKQQTQQDVFTSIQNLIDSIKNDGAEPARLSYNIGVALQNLDIADVQILQVRAQIGARLNVIDSQKDILSRFELLIKENIGSLQDLDFTKAISDLTQQQFLLEAAQRSYLRIQNLSLFNFFR